MTHPETRDLDTLLSESAPHTSEHEPRRTAALEAMARETSPRLSRRGRRGLRVVVVSAIGAATLGLGSVAAADALGWDAPWADDAAGEYTYTLPSGAQCSAIVGNVRGPDDAVAEANAFLERDDLLDRIDIDAAIAFLRAWPTTYDRDDGTTVDAGPGTEYWTSDFEYEQAMTRAVSEALWQHLADEGYKGDFPAMSADFELNCPDADLPAWLGQAGD